MKKNHSTILLLLVFLAGLSLLLYPTFSDWWNSLHQSQAVAGYAQQVADMDDDTYQKMWDDAWDYNASLVERTNALTLTDHQRARYDGLLNLGNNSVMGYIEIPKIGVTLPIYHGTDEAVLQVAVGHLEWTSLPVGGESSHCVVSGHRGLPSAKLFTNLDKLQTGDTFQMCVLDEVLTYEVDQIRIVEPHQTDDLRIAEGEDLCTLVTCTPYGINSHRLLVRGHRIENAEKSTIRVTSDAMQIEPLLVAPVVALPMLIVLLIFMLRPKRSHKKHGGDD
jgi:sortase A